MNDDMPLPGFWVSITVSGEEHYVHIRESGAHRRIGPFPSHHAAALAARDEWEKTPRDQENAA